MSSVVVWRDRLGLVEVEWNKGSAPSISYDFEPTPGGCHAERVYEATITEALETGFAMMRDVHLQAVRAAMRLPGTDHVPSLNTAEENMANLTRNVSITRNGDGVLVSYASSEDGVLVDPPIAFVENDEAAAKLVSDIMVLAERRIVDATISRLEDGFLFGSREEYRSIAEAFRPTRQTTEEHVLDMGRGLETEGAPGAAEGDAMTAIDMVVQETIARSLEQLHPLPMIQAPTP